jgi:hypothetical protein
MDVYLVALAVLAALFIAAQFSRTLHFYLKLAVCTFATTCYPF